MRVESECRVRASTGYYLGRQSGDVQVYRGIRYALPLEADGRFRPPVPVPESQDLIDARSFSPVAPQPGLLAHLSGTDCLSLNVWRNVASGGDAPVLFYIHGGTFVHGSGRERVLDGTYLARYWNVVVVTINYRLGAFGFLDFSCFGGGCVANAGLHDIVLALQWTYRNIEAFGGDPDLITVAGQSSGAALAALLPVVEGVAPLIARLLLASGIPTAYLPAETEAALVQRFLSFHGVADLAGLRGLRDELIVRKTHAFMQHCGLTTTTFQPTIDGTYVRCNPIDQLRRGEGRAIPTLVGSTRDELSVTEFPVLRRFWNFRYIIDSALAREESAVIDAIRAYYGGRLGGRENRIQLISDMVFRVAGVIYAEAASTSAPVWLYRFDFRPPLMRLSGFGAVHASDLPLLFGNLREGVGKLMFGLTRDLTGAMQLARAMQSDLITFMRTAALPWPQAFRDGFVAKCYDSVTSLVEPLPHEVYRYYQRTEYYAMHNQARLR